MANKEVNQDVKQEEVQETQTVEQSAKAPAYYTEKYFGNFTRKELDTLRSTVAAGTNNEQFALFIQTCINTGLNPFLNQIYCIVYDGKYGPKMSVQVSVEGIMSLARKQSDFDGFIADVVKENDEFEADVSAGEVTHKVKTMIRGKTLGAYCLAKRKDAPNILTIVTIDEVEHMKNGRNKDMWNNWFDDMLRKHTIKRAFKLQYGIEITENEPVSSSPINSIPDYTTRKTVDITPETQTESAKEEKPDPKKILEEKWSEARKRAYELGLLTDTQHNEYFEQKTGKKLTEIKIADLTGLLKIMDMEIKQKEAALVKEVKSEPVDEMAAAMADFDKVTQTTLNL